MKQIPEICSAIYERIASHHIRPLAGKKLFVISSQYNGLWLEHVYDAVMFAKMDKAYLPLAKDTIEVFIEHQKDGQYPFRIAEMDGVLSVEYSQVQECVSFLSLALTVSDMLSDRAFDEKVFESGKKWISWLETYRMTRKTGLLEMFVGFDTGHDYSGRLEGLSCIKKQFLPSGEAAPASLLPPNDNVAPILAVDISCNFFGNLMALSRFAEKLGQTDEAAAFREKAAETKRALFTHCFSKEDAFFYDVDKNGNLRKYLSSTIFHLFLEGVLDPEADKELIDEIYTRHMKNPEEFWTPYPFPSMAISDESCARRIESNCWGYYTQGLIALRGTLWMDKYGFSAEYDYICEKWLEAWARSFGTFNLGQELDPITGDPTPSSEWYSSTMLMFLYAAKRLGKIK